MSFFDPIFFFFRVFFYAHLHLVSARHGSCHGIKFQRLESQGWE